eukprot:COSAG01_NODE_17275_length_1164_cov_1.404695_1_plen_43_part_00
MAISDADRKKREEEALSKLRRAKFQGSVNKLKKINSMKNMFG